MRGKLRRLERTARKDLESFELEDSSWHYYEPRLALRGSCTA
jgi:hypothetical protein